MSEFNYQRYLASREWGVRREAVRERSGGACERCGLPMRAVHHVTYERIGHEDLDDLQAVCDPCHNFVGGRSDLDPANFSLPVFEPEKKVSATILLTAKVLHQALAEWGTDAFVFHLTMALTKAELRHREA